MKAAKSARSSLFEFSRLAPIRAHNFRLPIVRGFGIVASAMPNTIQQTNGMRFASASKLEFLRWNGVSYDLEKRLAFAGLALLILASGYLLHIESSIDLNRRLLALLVIWLGSLPSFIYLLDSHRPQIPFFPLVGLFYASNFGLSLFAANPESSSADELLRIEDISANSLWYVISGIVCMLVAFYVCSNLFRRPASPAPAPRDYLSVRFQRCLWCLLAVYFGYRFFPALKSIPSLGHLVSPLSYLGFGFLFYLSLHGRLSILKSLALWLVFVPLEVAFRLASGSIAETMIFALFFSLIALRFAPKRALLAFVLAITTLAIFNPVKGTFRTVTWYSDQEGSGPQVVYEKCAFLLELACDYHLGTTMVAPTGFWADTSTLSSVANRLSSMTVMSLVVQNTPSTIPYWKGQSYLPFFTKVIPRALWPGKPVDDMGNEFGHRYYLLGDQDEATSINLPWLVELYANFGPFGLFLGMGSIGAGMAWLDRAFNPRKKTPVELVIGASLLLQMVYQESSFSLMAGDFLLLYAILRLVLSLILPVQRVASGYRRRPPRLTRSAVPATHMRC